MRIAGTPVAFVDFETELIAPGNALPRPAIATTYLAPDEAAELNVPALSGAQLWYTHQLEGLWTWLLTEAIAGRIYIGGHDVARFDCNVTGAHYPHLRLLLKQALDANRIVDTIQAERIIEIHRHQRGGAGLDDLCRKYGHPFVDKSDPETQAIRMSFGQFIGATELPPAHAEYALHDAYAPAVVLERQLSTELVDIEDLGEFCRRAYNGGRVSARGFRTAPDRVERLAEMVDAKLRDLETIAREYGFLRANRDGTVSKNKKAIQIAVACDYAGQDRPDFTAAAAKSKAELNRQQKAWVESIQNHPAVPRTDASETYPNGQIKTDRLTLEDASDPKLQTLAEWDQLLYIRNKDLKIFRDGAAAPVHTRFTIVDTTRYGSSNPQCFDGATEVLTPQGWVRFDALDEGVAVAQWHEHDGSIDFVVPTAYVRQVAPEMVHLASAVNIDLLLTPDHRCPLRHRRTGALRVFRADEYPEDWKQIQAGEYVGGNIALPSAFVTMLCAAQADGSYVKGGGMRFAFSKQRKADRLRAALTTLGWGFREAVYTTGPKPVHEFYLGKDSEGSTTLKCWLGEAKTFGWWVLRFDKRALHDFCDEVWHWDGLLSRKTMYASKLRVNADIVQAACVLRGWRARINPRRTAVEGVASWQVDVVRSDCCSTTRHTATRVPWSDDVYCVSVPSTFLLVRRGANCAISGNCHNFGKAKGVRECITARPGYALVVSDFKMLELVSLAQLCVDQLGLHTMAAKIRDGVDMHAEIGADVLGISYDEIQARRKAGDHDADEARDSGKPANFGLNGGMTDEETYVLYARKSYGQLLCEQQPGESNEAVHQRRLAKAREIIAAWRGRAVDQQAWIEHVRRTGYRLGDRGTRYDMQHPGFKNLWRRGLSRTEATNNPFQIVGANVSHRAVGYVLDAQYLPGGDLNGSHMVLTTHDDIVSEVPLHLVAEHASVQEELMARAARELCPGVFHADTPTKRIVDTRVLTHLSKSAPATRGSDGALQVTAVAMPTALK